MWRFTDKQISKIKISSVSKNTKACVQFNNYRPISVLPAFSKILEKIIYNRMINYFDKYNILCNQQYGFRRGHSTSLTLIQLFDKISSAIDEKKFTIAIFLDL